MGSPVFGVSSGVSCTSRFLSEAEVVRFIEHLFVKNFSRVKPGEGSGPKSPAIPVLVKTETSRERLKWSSGKTESEEDA